jgi:uncharacterized membrane protein (DUF4010 family)
MALPSTLADNGPLLLGLAVALGGGLLIGLERERRKGDGPARRAAGIRSFALVALAGALAQALGQPALVAAGALAVVLLAGLAYGFDRWRAAAQPALADPGMTTELALVVTYLVGVLALQRPALGAGCAAVVAVLLAARGRLHHFATRLLTEQELHDGLLLAALGLVLLPLVPQQPVAWLAGLQPSVLAGLVLLILLLQAAGHMALRWAGPGIGLPLSGLLGGFVSSTATVAAMGSRRRAQPALAGPCTAAAVLSTGATWLQALMMLWAVAPPLALRLTPALLAAATVALGLGGVLAWRSRQALAAGALPPTGGGALQVRQALLVAALLTGVALLVTQADRSFGQAGTLASVALAGLADAHAGVTAVAALSAQGRIDVAGAGIAVLVAIGANGLTRVAVGWGTGGQAHAGWVALALAAALGTAAALVASAGAAAG